MNKEYLFFLQDHFYIPLYFFTWAISAFRYKRYFDTALKYLPIFIAYTFFTELLGYFIKHHEEFLFFSDDRYITRNVIIYNAYQIVCFIFFYWVYWKTLRTPRFKNWVKYGAYLSILSQLISGFFQNPFYVHLYYANIIGSLVLVMAIFFYFKEKQSEPNPMPQKYNLLFWISTGLLVFYLFFPFILLLGYVNYSFYAQFNLRTVLLFLIVFMYLCINLGLLIGKRKAFR
ncbi:MAG: hypothetical protein AAF575_00705 [Bacteroidota bacterium]